MKESSNIIIENSSDNNKEIKEKQNSIKKQTNICQLCFKKYSKDPNIKCIIFKDCDHEICYICLYKILLRSYIKSISQIYSSNNKFLLSSSKYFLKFFLLFSKFSEVFLQSSISFS